MDSLDGWITCVFLGSSHHEIIGSVEKKKLQTSFSVISNIQILCGVWGLKDRASEKKISESVDLSHLEIE